MESELINEDCRYTQDNWKITYEAYKEQTKEEQELELPKEGVRVKFKIMKSSDEKRFALEFQRLAGS